MFFLDMHFMMAVPHQIPITIPANAMIPYISPYPDRIAILTGHPNMRIPRIIIQNPYRKKTNGAVAFCSLYSLKLFAAMNAPMSTAGEVTIYARRAIKVI